MRAPGAAGPGDVLRRPGATALLALALGRRAPLVGLALALLARARIASAARSTGDASLPGPGTGTGTAERALVRWGTGLLAARLLAPTLLAPVALVGSLALVLGVVLVLAGGIAVGARVAGLG